MNVTHDMIYGYTDSIILRFLSAGDNYGYEINRSIAQKSKGRLALKEATLYTALRRLEKDGRGAGTTQSLRRGGSGWSSG